MDAHVHNAHPVYERPTLPCTNSHGHDLDPSSSSATDEPPPASTPGHGSGHSNSLLVLRQVRGISQGSVLSPALCHLYLGSVEAGLLDPDPPPDEDEEEDEDKRCCPHCCVCLPPRQRRRGPAASLVLRLVDDYLCVSTSLPTAKRFLDRVYARLPAIGAWGYLLGWLWCLSG
jgi:hypothetical protein